MKIVSLSLKVPNPTYGGVFLVGNGASYTAKHIKTVFKHTKSYLLGHISCWQWSLPILLNIMKTVFKDTKSYLWWCIFIVGNGVFLYC